MIPAAIQPGPSTLLRTGDTITVKSWWGIQEMTAIGRGAYPYDCISRDRHPDVMIFVNDKGGWLGDYQLAGPNEYGQFEAKY